MHARDLAEMALFAASRGPARVALGKRFNDRGLVEYWSASKRRYELWLACLKSPETTDHLTASEKLQSVIEEVLSSEMLTRVWTAIGCACDEAAGVEEAGPILINIWNVHLQARHRVLGRMVTGGGLSLEQLIAVNRTRRLCERWTDLLLGHLFATCPVGKFAHSPRRVRQFADEMAQNRGRDRGWDVLRASLSFSLHAAISSAVANPDLNRQVAGAVLSECPSDTFDSTGLPKSLWLIRMERTSEEAGALLDRLLDPNDHRESALQLPPRHSL
jgi:hypothetical protein